MNWLFQALWSSVGKKLMMAVTGFGFLLFLSAHLMGNLTIYGGSEAFNAYADRLHSLGALLTVFNLGLIVLAVIHDREMSETMGVNVRRVYVVSFSAGVFLAALGGAITAPMISVTPGLGVSVIITAFAVVIIGGLGSIEGAAIGAVLVGIARAASVHIMPEAELFIIYLVMAVVLLFRPEGLFQKIQARKI